MGKKTTATALITLLLLSTTMTVKAESVDALLGQYNLTPSELPPIEIREIVSEYDKAKKFVAMYNYVDMSKPDSSIQDSRLASLVAEVEDIDKQLLNGFNLTRGEILTLEERQHVALEEIQRLEETKKFVRIKIEVPKSSEVPTVQEYTTALLEIEEFYNAHEIGDTLRFGYPSTSKLDMKKHNINETLFEFKGSVDVISLFSGYVTYVDEEIIEVTTCKDVVITYKGLSNIYVEKDAWVDQKEQLGTAKGNFTVSLRIRGEKLDLNRLWEERKQ